MVAGPLIFGRKHRVATSKKHMELLFTLGIAKWI